MELYLLVDPDCTNKKLSWTKSIQVELIFDEENHKLFYKDAIYNCQNLQLSYPL
jgi:hypothetical protein